MRYPYIILFLCIAYVACKKNNEQQGSKIYEEYIFVNNKQIESTNNNGQGPYLNYKTIPGNKTVFQYSAVTDNSGVRHYGHTGYLLFQADSGVTYFAYKDSTLREHLTYYYSMAGMPRDWGSTVRQGTIEGEKQANGTWKVKIDIILSNPDAWLNLNSINKNEVFTEKDKL